MELSQLRQLVFDLCQSPGTPGDETQAAQTAAQALARYATVRLDGNGNVLGEMGPQEGKPLLLDAHMDQIGLIVTQIDPKGFLHVAPCGGMDRRVLPGCPVRVLGRRVTPGIVCCLPPHLTNGEDKNAAPPVADMAVDVGLPAETARQWIAPGDRIVVSSSPKALLGNRISAPALDDRAGVAALIRCAQLLQGKALPRRVVFLFSAQEETGSAGASTAAYRVDPAEAVAVDVDFAQQPGVKPENAGRLGGGPMIAVAPALSHRVYTGLRSLAQQQGIPVQSAVMGGGSGTNADHIAVTRRGVPCGVLSIPQRSMHTAAEICDLQDIEHTAQLLAAYAQQGGFCPNETEGECAQDAQIEYMI